VSEVSDSTIFRSKVFAFSHA